MFIIILMNGLPGAISYLFQGKYLLLLQAEGKNYINTALTSIISTAISITKIVLLLLGFNIIAIQAVYLILNLVKVVYFHNFLARSFLILTDSGGIQEEAPSLGKPVLVMRDTTERPEGVTAGTLKLVGTNEESIYQNFKNLIQNSDDYQKMALTSNPYGDGFACKRIADILCASLI